MQALSWTRAAWQAISAEEVKACWDRTSILPVRLCSDADAPHATENELAAQAALQHAVKACNQHAPESEVQHMLSAEVIASADACVEVHGASAEQHSIREIESNLKEETAGLDQPEDTEIGEGEGGERALIHDLVHALQIASELQRYADRHSAALGEQCVQATDLLVNRTRRTPVHSDMKQATLLSMLQIELEKVFVGHKFSLNLRMH